MPFYFTISLIAVICTIGLLKNYIGGPFNIEYDTSFVVGISLLIAGIWTLCTYDSFYITKTGEKKQMHEDNTFFFVHMKLWGYIFIAGGSLLLIGGTLTMMKVIE